MFIARLCEGRYEIEEYTVQVRDDGIDEYPNHRLPLLAYTATVNGSASAPYRLDVKNVVDRLWITGMRTTGRFGYNQGTCWHRS